MAYPFAAAEVLTAVDLNAMIGAPTQNTQTGTTYTFGLADAGKVNTFDNASPVTATLPAQATVSWPANTVLPVLCLGAGTVTITPAAGVTINGTPLTLATSKGGSLVRTASNVWTFIPFSGGVEAANFTDTATGTYTDGGIDYKYITFTGSGSLVVDQAGFADVLVIGGGGGGGTAYAGGGGAGGYRELRVLLTAGTIAITVGAGGAAGTKGSDSLIGSIITSEGGGRGSAESAGGAGGSGGGGGGSSGTSFAGGAGTLNQGSNGGSGANSASNQAGGGGGSRLIAGTNASAAVGGRGAAGIASLITNTATLRAGGGGGGSRGGTAGAGGSGGGGAGTNNNATATAGTANTGSGGGGGGFTSGGGGAGGAGGSGLIIVRVVV